MGVMRGQVVPPGQEQGEKQPGELETRNLKLETFRFGETSLPSLRVVGCGFHVVGCFGRGDGGVRSARRVLRRAFS